MFYSTANTGGESVITFKDLHDDYAVTFSLVDCVPLGNASEIPMQQQDQILNIFTRDLFHCAGFRKYQKTQAYFKEAKTLESQCDFVEGANGKNSLAILKGYE